MIIGYKLIDRRTGEVVNSWGGVWGSCPGIPNPLLLPGGDQVCGAALGAHGHFDLVAWEGAPGVEQIEAETQRRIMLLLNTNDINKCIAKQVNAQMRASMLNYKIARRVALTEAEQHEVVALFQMAEDIQRLRNNGKRLEQMPTIPADYAADHHWERD